VAERRTWAKWLISCGIALGALALVMTLALYLRTLGLEDADRTASVVSMFFTVGGFLLAAIGLFTPRQSMQPPTAIASQQEQTQSQRQDTRVTVVVTAAQVGEAPSDLTVKPDQLVIGEMPGQPRVFVERPQAIEIAAAFRAGAGGRVVVSAVGGRGVGKTQLAAAYARTRVGEGCPLVAWVSGETTDTLLAGLAEVADAVGCADPGGDSARSASCLRDHLAARKEPALLVVDDATDPGALLPLLPATGTCEILITTNDQEFAEVGHPVKVDIFGRAESISYLVTATMIGERDGANAVAEALGDLPVALASVPAVMRSQQFSYREYVDRLSRVNLDSALPRSVAAHYPHSTAQAFILALDAVEAGDMGGRDPGGAARHRLAFP